MEVCPPSAARATERLPQGAPEPSFGSYRGICISPGSKRRARSSGKHRRRNHNSYERRTVASLLRLRRHGFRFQPRHLFSQFLADLFDWVIAVALEKLRVLRAASLIFEH